ncbi:MAG: proteasome subunit alpha [Actinomycetales bacterium]|nr:proteasome subunit alpha [Actinomycetales bacterium]
MSMPFYVSPEQLMKDKADYARKGIARGRSVVVLQYDRGIAFVAENPQSLRKISEIYDRIAFAAVGMYYEFENLRVAGIRYADLRGYSYDRSDVTARGLANAYAQTLGTVFTQEPKPYEIELCVAEVGRTEERDQIYRLTYDGSVSDQHGAMVMGGASAAAEEWIKARWNPGLSLADALALAVSALAADPAGGEPRVLSPGQLEVAVLDRHRPRRTFRRIVGPLLVDLLNADSPTAHAPETDEGIPGHPDILSASLVDTAEAAGQQGSSSTATDPSSVEHDPRVPPPSDERGPASTQRVETGDDPT